MIEQIKIHIDSAKTLKSMNELRQKVVRNMTADNGLLEYWQKKWWGLKTCKHCGHVRR